MIRKMTSEDVEQVAEIERQSFHRPWSVNALLKECGNESALFLVDEEDGTVIGYMGMYLMIDEADVTNIAYLPEWRNKGRGQILLKQAMQITTEQGYPNMTLEVRAGNAAAIHVYQKLGFVSEGIRKNFYDSPKEDANIMWYRP